MGGNLTHGEDHLTEPLPPILKEALGMGVISEKLLLLPEIYQKLPLYFGVVKSILNQKCVSCYNPKNAKCERLLHNYRGIMDGGEEGPIISLVNTEESEILNRIYLPREEE